MAQIKVLITDTTGANEQVSVSSSGANGVNNTIASNNDSNVADNKKSSKMLAAATMIGSQALNYTTSNIGKWTGDSRNQTKVNNIGQIITLGAMAYASPYLALAVAAINIGTTTADEMYERKWETKRSELARARAGELKGRGH